VVDACAAAAVLAWSVSAPAGAPSDESGAPERVRLLDVPFVPQSEALCGGAALAMVLRYWGMPSVLAEDFALLVEPGSGGIRTSALVKAVEAFGWSAFSVSGTPAEIESHLVRGLPVIALIRVGSDSFHFVVLVAWANGWVVVHDPSVGPFRVIREEEFDAAWSGGSRWALLVLPPPETDREGAQEPTATSSRSSAVPDACEALVEAGVLSAQAGDTAQAELRFLAAQSLCPASSAPFRERAGLRFFAEDWAGASRLAERALALDPGDTHSWRLLAGSRFLAGDVEGALQAWNHLSEPRADLTRIDGLARIRYSSVAGQLDLPPGRLLTPQAFRQARRRLAEVPAQVESRLSLRPLPEGIAQVDVTLLERPPVFGGPWNVASAGIKALTGQELALDVASPTGNGELWAAAWRWQSNRPRVSLALTTPAAEVRPGIWRVDSYWERQTYAARILSDTSGLNRSEPNREERRHTGLSFSDWIAPDVRLEIGAALDRWVDRGSHVSLEGRVETRWARDRLALRAQFARWLSLSGGAPFGNGGVSLIGSSSGLERCDAWQGRLGISATTSGAPLALWSGAGTGSGRAPLLRAHPLVRAGVIEGRMFGRTLAHGTIERQAWPWRLGPVQLGWALFVDGAKAWERGLDGYVPWQVDGGAGLRLRGLGARGQFRIDAALGFEDGSAAMSIAWQIP
jgi:hypothetical protein